MKYPKYLVLAAVLVLMGAGCAATTDTRIEDEGGLNPAGTSPEGTDAGIDTSLDADGSATMEVPVPGFEEEVDEMIVEEDPDGATPDDAPIANHIVTFNGSSYSTMNLTVKAGDTVTWRNEGTVNFWPASNVHPTHQQLPGFDAGKAIGPGGSYSFTFTKSGAWGWHDHLRPTVIGTITVQ